MATYTAIGMMSGTSMDGLDASVIRTDGENIVEVIDHFIIPYDPAFHQALKLAIKSQDKEKIAVMEDVLTRMHVLSVESLLAKTGLDRTEINVIGMHGQTIHHAPDKGETWQIGDGQMLADMTGINVVNDFRQADVKAGGQGAPLVPIYHRAITSKLEKPIILLNIGGIANITWINGQGQMLACDTGMGNALLNDWIHEKTGAMYDNNGDISAKGTINQVILEQLLSHPFFSELPPKSLDREAFNLTSLSELSLEDGAATLVEFTVEAIYKIMSLLPEPPKEWLVCGGGRHNKYMMQRLQERLSSPVTPIEKIGYNGDTLEAEAFAYMAVKHLKKLPISFTGTTGVLEPTCGGKLYHNH